MRNIFASSCTNITKIGIFAIALHVEPMMKSPQPAENKDSSSLASSLSFLPAYPHGKRGLINGNYYSTQLLNINLGLMMKVRKDSRAPDAVIQQLNAVRVRTNIQSRPISPASHTYSNHPFRHDDTALFYFGSFHQSILSSSCRSIPTLYSIR